MVARRRVAWSRQALRNLDEVLGHVAEVSPQGAASVARSALDLAESLSTLAERGRVVPEIGRPEIREVFAFRYRLMYRVEPEAVTIIAFIHGARDFARWRREVDL